MATSCGVNMATSCGSWIYVLLLLPLLLRVSFARVILGNQILRDSGYAALVGRRVAVLSNPTGVFQDTLGHIVDDLVQQNASSQNNSSNNHTMEVALLLSPEHGFRGDRQAESGDPLLYRDAATGLPVLSAYKLSPTQLARALSEFRVDAVVVDLQDVGVRLYTFIWTMYGVMQAAAIMEQQQQQQQQQQRRRGGSSAAASSSDSGSGSGSGSGSNSSSVRFLVLDRPNPLGGLAVDGPLLNVSCCSSGYGRVAIPHIHGMTYGELATLFNDHLGDGSDFGNDGTSGIDGAALSSSSSSSSSANSNTSSLQLSDLRVVRMEGWRRADEDWTSSAASATVTGITSTTAATGGMGLAWVPPSPNLPTPASASAYGATVFLEATTVAEGRGTTTPFTLFGAPFLDAAALAETLNAAFARAAEPASSSSHLSSSSSSLPSRALFRAAYFMPTYSKYNGTDCAGVQWVRGIALSLSSSSQSSSSPSSLFSSSSSSSSSSSASSSSSSPSSSSSSFRHFRAGLEVLTALRDLSPPGAFRWDGSWFGHDACNGTELIDDYMGTPRVREMIDAGLAASAVAAAFEEDAATFRVSRRPYLLY